MRLLSALAPPLCCACRLPSPAREPLCARCRRQLEYLPRAIAVVAGVDVWAPLAYEGPARAIVRRLKFHGAGALAWHMAAAIVANAPAGFLDAPLVPVPSPRSRRRTRGFCHAELLARAVAARTGLPVLRLLERTGGARRQVGRPRAARLQSPPRFRATTAGAGRVLVVDDVLTTGATLGACVIALRAAGWDAGAALAYARTPVR